MKIAWSPQAIRHLVRLPEYIGHDSEPNAAMVASRILQAVELLQFHPEMGRTDWVLSTRELVVPDTP